MEQLDNPASPVSRRLASAKHATLMDLLTPSCRAARQSPGADLPHPPPPPAPLPLICLSPKDETDQVDVLPSNHPIMAGGQERREEYKWGGEKK